MLIDTESRKVILKAKASEATLEDFFMKAHVDDLVADKKILNKVQSIWVKNLWKVLIASNIGGAMLLYLSPSISSVVLLGLLIASLFVFFKNKTVLTNFIYKGLFRRTKRVQSYLKVENRYRKSLNSIKSEGWYERYIHYKILKYINVNEICIHENYEDTYAKYAALLADNLSRGNYNEALDCLVELLFLMREYPNKRRIDKYYYDLQKEMEIAQVQELKERL